MVILLLASCSTGTEETITKKADKSIEGNANEDVEGNANEDVEGYIEDGLRIIETVCLLFVN